LLRPLHSRSPLPLYPFTANPPPRSGRPRMDQLLCARLPDLRACLLLRTRLPFLWPAACPDHSGLLLRPETGPPHSWPAAQPRHPGLPPLPAPPDRILLSGQAYDGSYPNPADGFSA
jgi:hypothetical protein